MSIEIVTFTFSEFSSMKDWLSKYETQVRQHLKRPDRDYLYKKSKSETLLVQSFLQIWYLTNFKSEVLYVSANRSDIFKFIALWALGELHRCLQVNISLDKTKVERFQEIKRLLLKDNE